MVLASRYSQKVLVLNGSNCSKSGCVYSRRGACFQMVELSWSQTPNSLWWALESSVTTTSLDDLLSSPTTSPQRHAGSLRNQTNSPTIFYNYADETDFAESEADLTQWVKEHHNRGIIRFEVYIMILNTCAAWSTPITVTVFSAKICMHDCGCISKQYDMKPCYT